MQVCQCYGPLLTPLVCKPTNFFCEAPSFLHLHAEHLITSLDTIYPSPVNLGPKLTHNLQMLHPSKHLIEQLDHIIPVKWELVKSVNALIKEAASRKKHTLEEEDGPEDVEAGRPKKREKLNLLPQDYVPYLLMKS